MVNKSITVLLSIFLVISRMNNLRDVTVVFTTKISKLFKIYRPRRVANGRKNTIS